MAALTSAWSTYVRLCASMSRKCELREPVTEQVYTASIITQRKASDLPRQANIRKPHTRPPESTIVIGYSRDCAALLLSSSSSRGVHTSTFLRGLGSGLVWRTVLRCPEMYPPYLSLFSQACANLTPRHKHSHTTSLAALVAFPLWLSHKVPSENRFSAANRRFPLALCPSKFFFILDRSSHTLLWRMCVSVPVQLCFVLLVGSSHF
jgi:hypothetical protein